MKTQNPIHQKSLELLTTLYNLNRNASRLEVKSLIDLLANEAPEDSPLYHFANSAEHAFDAACSSSMFWAMIQLDMDILIRHYQVREMAEW